MVRIDGKDLQFCHLCTQSFFVRRFTNQERNTDGIRSEPNHKRRKTQYSSERMATTNRKTVSFFGGRMSKVRTGRNTFKQTKNRGSYLRSYTLAPHRGRYNVRTFFEENIHIPIYDIPPSTTLEP